jgi:hypothetical protein
VAVTQSAAWRGRASAGGTAALARLNDYITLSEEQVKIVSGNSILLAGTSGETPVSIANGLPYPVQVRIHASVPPGSQLSISNPDPLVTIPANQTYSVRLQVHSAALGSALLQLQLLTKDWVPLAGRPQSLNLETTRYGAALLILIAAALGVLVLTSVVRWVRRWLHDGGSGHHVSGRSVSEDSVREDGASADGAGAYGPDVNRVGVNDAGVGDVRGNNAISGQRASRAGGGSGGTG